MDKIIIRGAREHNLKNVNLELPKNQMIVFTGVSGSGKSSLAFDTIFAEGQRRYIESLSAYARQFLGQKDKPNVDSIEGLMPAISIDQKSAGHNPRSTVATVTEIYDYLRVLFARIGQPHCPKCGKKIVKMSVDEIVEYIIRAGQEKFFAGDENARLMILAPVVRGRKGEYHQLLNDLYMAGFAKVRINGMVYSLGERISLDRYKAQTIEIVVDQLPIKNFPVTRLVEAVETALEKGKNVITLIWGEATEQTISSKFHCPSCDRSFIEIEPRLFSFNSPYGACEFCHGLGTKFFWSEEPCPACSGARLRQEALSIKVSDKNIVELVKFTVKDAYEFIDGLITTLSDRELLIAERLLTEISNRLQFLNNVGLDYLTLDRRASSLSGGEAQRIRLASQVGSHLTGVLYVLDEPTIGLHPKDTERLISTLHLLRNLSNTVIVVEHDPGTILASDHLVEIGPGAGRLGGQIVVNQPLKTALSDSLDSPTVAYLTGRRQIVTPRSRRQPKPNRTLKVIGASGNNLKNIDVEIPLGLLVGVTGVSGSGKSTLVEETIYKALMRQLYQSPVIPQKHAQLNGIEMIDKVVLIDQSPIGRTPRSNAATYTGVLTFIRDLFSSLPAARERGYPPGRFSFNVPSVGEGGRGGRCETCQGDGYLKIEMHFLPDVYVPCEVCQGKRFAKETLEVKYNGLSIADVLDLTVSEALEFFGNLPMITDKLTTLAQVGLDYLKLGQSAPTLSGGEAQRVKLATELSRRPTSRTIYILDEPTVGLHFVDVDRLIQVLQKLVSRGSTVIVIEHNLDVIKSVDWLIDLGPGGGDQGGRVIAVGPPEEVAENDRSATGQFLRQVLA